MKIQYSPRAKDLLRYAEKKACQLGHLSVSVDLFWWALLERTNGVGYEALQKQGCKVDEVLDALRQNFGVSDGLPTMKRIRLNPEAIEVLIQAGYEAGLMKLNYIGTEHILLGLVGVETELSKRFFKPTIDQLRSSICDALRS